MVATLAKQARETSDRIYLEEMYGMVDYRNGVPRSTLTKLVNWFRRYYREARLVVLTGAPPDALPPPYREPSTTSYGIGTQGSA